MKSKLIILLLLVNFLLRTTEARSQDCNPADLAKIPGTWRSNKDGSIHNVSPADLASERKVLTGILESMKARYQPVGGVLSHSNFHTVPLGEGKNWVASPYGHTMRFLEYVCEKDPKTNLPYKPAPETSAMVTFYVNQASGVQETGGSINLYAADLPDDHSRGYLLLEKWPEQKGDLLYWEFRAPSERHPIGQKAWMVAYPGKSPLAPLTKGEYLALKIPLLRQYHEEMQGYHREIDPQLDVASKRVYDESLLNLKAHEDLIKSTEAQLGTMTPSELAEPAIIERGEPNGEFRGFKTANDLSVYHLAKPNPGYFDRTLPKWVPQFITVTIQYDTSEAINLKNIQMMEKAIDWEALRELLGRR
ncbi:hypothetical protein BA6E_10227 [Bacteroidales bacterium 6E]|nr:hypothetical protein BA6E_10227 [Bacteroidales bacterium 6E]